MLEYLRIRSLALIDDIEMEFASGLNVLSGETGAGKSFILKALNFLTGDKLSTDMVRPGQEKAQVEALFIQEQGGEAVEYSLRRELIAETNRSRLFINGELSSQETVRNLRASLILHTSQHGQQKLLQPAYQNRILDGFITDPAPLDKKDALLENLRRLADKKLELEERSRGLVEKREFLEYQLKEIDKVDPKQGEEEELERRRDEARVAAEAQAGVSRALDLLCTPETGMRDTLTELERALQSLTPLESDFEHEREQVENFRLHIYELERTLRAKDSLNADEDVEAIEKRLWELTQLRRKLKRPLEEIVTLRDEISENLSFLDSCGLELKQLIKEEFRLCKELAQVLDTLRAARNDAARRFNEALRNELCGLGFSEHVQVMCEFSEHELYPAPQGLPALTEPRARFLWQPNPGQAPQPLDKIASGGELSRFLLAIVGLRGQADLPTLIFDEVDSGVGGITLTRVGERLQALSDRQQVILISHWPQLASLAKRHFLVQKDFQDGQTYTSCRRLTGQSVFDELSRMAGGGAQGEAMARELVELRGQA